MATTLSKHYTKQPLDHNAILAMLKGRGLAVADDTQAIQILRFPPAWKLLEITSFGCLTKLYFNFSNIKAKKRVARSYSIPSHETLESWMKAVCTMRNTCAHYARLWNRTMPVMPQMSDKLRGKWLTNITKPANKFYAVASCMAYWLNAINPANTFVADFKTLLAKYPNIDTAAMGFPKNWQDEPLWK